MSIHTCVADHDLNEPEMIDTFERFLLSLRPDLEGKSPDSIYSIIKADMAIAQQVHNKQCDCFQMDATSTNLGGLLSRVGHITRVVRDAERSVQFYRNVLGAVLLNRPNIATNGYWLWLGNTQLHLVQSDLAVTPDHPQAGTRVNHISFDVCDLSECEKRLQRAGIAFNKSFVVEGDCGVTQIFFQDPDNHWIELCDCQKIEEFVFRGLKTATCSSFAMPSPLLQQQPPQQQHESKGVHASIRRVDTRSRQCETVWDKFSSSTAAVEVSTKQEPQIIIEGCTAASLSMTKPVPVPVMKASSHSATAAVTTVTATVVTAVTGAAATATTEVLFR